MPLPRRLPPFVALIAGVVSISWSAIFVRWAEMPGVASAFYRVVIAAGVMWCVLLIRSQGRLRIERRVLVLAGMAGGLRSRATWVVTTWRYCIRRRGVRRFWATMRPLLVGLMTWIVTKRRAGGSILGGAGGGRGGRLPDRFGGLAQPAVGVRTCWR